MFPSILIISSSPEQLLQEVDQKLRLLPTPLSPVSPDLMTIDYNSGYGIAQIRQIKNFLSQKPFSASCRAVVIHQADQLETVAQNALLKVLEEPGENRFFILTTGFPGRLLTTILSRCHTIRTTSKTSALTDTDTINITGDIKNDLLQSQIIGQNKDDILPYLKAQLRLLQQLLVNRPSAATTDQLKKITKAITMIESNVDPRSALDYVFLAP